MLAALALAGCSTVPAQNPAPPFLINAGGTRYIVVPLPIETLVVGDLVCWRSGGDWVYSKVLAIRGPGIYRVEGGGLTLLTASNYGGKMQPVPPTP